jgi:2-keto-4-pentenoate hydratase/2-oxohepta-3-ene-1,7-dioic acid hydratase in catechol pathway
MRIVRFLDVNGEIRWGRLAPGAKPETGPARLLAGDPLAGVRELDREAEVCELLSPIEPRAVLGVGLNYRAHAAETGQPLPERPVLFMKNPAALQHPGAPIRIPASCRAFPEVDYEGELAVVIGKPARDVSEKEALSYVLGYTAANDVSARRWQKHGGAGQWVRGKSFDTFCPIGPVLVTADEIGDPQSLRIRTRRNGETLQDGHTSDMVFPVARLVSDLSSGMTLLPGTVLLTGTPAGVGYARVPPVWLLPGDVVEVEIDRIGVLRNPVTD